MGIFWREKLGPHRLNINRNERKASITLAELDCSFVYSARQSFVLCRGNQDNEPARGIAYSHIENPIRKEFHVLDRGVTGRKQHAEDAERLDHALQQCR